MKKLSLVILSLLFVFSSFSQYGKTTKEVFEIIEMSRDMNMENGVVDPNLIYPGQELSFLFADGHQEDVVVEDGDNQWSIVAGLEPTIAEHGNIVPFVEPEEAATPAVVPPAVEPTEASFPWWIVAVIFGVLLFLYFMYRNWKNIDPVTSGPAIRQGGLHPQQGDELHTRAIEVAATSRGVSTMGIQIVSPIEYGVLNGRGNVRYLNGKTRLRNFENTPGYRATAQFPDGSRLQVHFLQGCANDVTYSGNWIENVLFTPNDIPVTQDQVEGFNQNTTTLANIESTTPAEQLQLAKIEAMKEMAGSLSNALTSNGGKIELSSEQITININAPVKTTPKVESLPATSHTNGEEVAEATGA